MDSPDQFGWVLWATTSPYSPLNLHYLPQPVPKDATADMEDGVFTFEDAFEDLLAVSSGRRLTDLSARYEMRKMLREMYPRGEDASFWVRRLHSQRLLDNCNFFPLQPVSPMWPLEVWEGFHREFRRAAEESGDEERRRRHGLFEDLERLLRSIESHVHGPKEKNKGDQKGESGEEADTFDDLYSSLQSAFSHGAKSLTTLIKMAKDGVTDIKDQSSWSSSSSTTSSTDHGGRPKKLERIESTEEFTDDQGNRHVKRTIRTLDEHGREVGKEVHVRIQSPRPDMETEKAKEGPRRNERPKEEPPHDERPRDGPGEDNNARNSSNNSNSRSSSDPSSGWFWR